MSNISIEAETAAANAMQPLVDCAVSSAHLHRLANAALKAALPLLVASAKAKWAAAKTEVKGLKGQRSELVELVGQELDSISEWGEYADPYFRKKWDLDGTLNQYRLRLTEILRRTSP